MASDHGVVSKKHFGVARVLDTNASMNIQLARARTPSTSQWQATMRVVSKKHLGLARVLDTNASMNIQLACARTPSTSQWQATMRVVSRRHLGVARVLDTNASMNIQLACARTPSTSQGGEQETFGGCPRPGHKCKYEHTACLCPNTFNITMASDHEGGEQETFGACPRPGHKCKYEHTACLCPNTFNITNWRVARALDTHASMNIQLACARTPSTSQWQATMRVVSRRHWGLPASGHICNYEQALVPRHGSRSPLSCWRMFYNSQTRARLVRSVAKPTLPHLRALRFYLRFLIECFTIQEDASPLRVNGNLGVLPQIA